MKRIAVIFVVLFVATLLIPTISIARQNQNEKEKQNELVTIFSSQIVNPCANYPLQVEEKQQH